MTTDLHLFSTPGDAGIEWIVEACRPYPKRHRDPLLAYLPLASLSADRMLDETTQAFRGFGRVESISTETMELSSIEAVLRSAAVAYIPGGNTYLLNHRLHISRLLPYLRKKLEAGLPLIAFSAGAVVCGPNILTSNDLNMLPTPHFEGLNLTPFNFNVHYSDDARRDNWLIDYRDFHDNPVILMEDGSYLRIRGKDARLVRGQAWIWRAGHEKERIVPGDHIIPYLEAQHG
ncbi:MAG: Type 1 glutamine amidotransferase-like domain-containing protein [Anaerolineae bacterium]